MAHFVAQSVLFYFVPRGAQNKCLFHKHLNQRPIGIEPTSRAWKARVIAIIRRAPDSSGCTIAEQGVCIKGAGCCSTPLDERVLMNPDEWVKVNVVKCKEGDNGIKE